MPIFSPGIFLCLYSIIYPFLNNLCTYLNKKDYRSLTLWGMICISFFMRHPSMPIWANKDTLKYIKPKLHPLSKEIQAMCTNGSSASGAGPNSQFCLTGPSASISCKSGLADASLYAQCKSGNTVGAQDANRCQNGNTVTAIGQQCSIGALPSTNVSCIAGVGV